MSVIEALNYLLVSVSVASVLAMVWVIIVNWGDL